MKAKGLKLISLIILLAMVFTAFGCDSTPEATAPTGNGELRGEDGRYIYINNIEKLNDYLKTQDVPDNFLTPDMLKELGSFNFFYTKEGKPLHNGYMYSFIHEDRYRVNFRFNSVFDSTLTEISETLLDHTMTKITENIHGTIISNGIKYCYLWGNLCGIEWTVNNTPYHIDLVNCTSEQLEEMPNALSEDSILRKLLSKDAEDQIAAFNQLKDMVTK